MIAWSQVRTLTCGVPSDEGFEQHLRLTGLAALGDTAPGPLDLSDGNHMFAGLHIDCLFLRIPYCVMQRQFQHWRWHANLDFDTTFFMQVSSKMRK